MKVANQIQTLFLMCMVAQAQPLMAFPSDGRQKPLGETTVRDEVEISTNSPDATAPPEAPLTSTPDAPSAEAQSVSSFSELDPFGEVASLQKKYLPKRHRFEFAIAYGQLLDNAFFETQELHGILGYSFSETVALELGGFRTDTRRSQAANSLYEYSGVQSIGPTEPESYLGLDLKWSPVYGKLAFWASSIVPVEQFFLVGWGTTALSGQTAESTIHLGTGLEFALRKWLSIRASLDVYSYASATGDHFNDTHLSIGLSTFFPGADHQ